MSAEPTAAAPPQPSSSSSSSSSGSSSESSSSEDERERKKRRRREKRKKEKKERKRKKRKREKKRRKKRKKEKHERRKRRKDGAALAASEGGAGVGPLSGSQLAAGMRGGAAAAGEAPEGGEGVPEDSSERHRRNWEARHRARERERAEQLQWQQRQQRTLDEIAPKPEAGRCAGLHPCCAAAGDLTLEHASLCSRRGCCAASPQGWSAAATTLPTWPAARLEAAWSWATTISSEMEGTSEGHEGLDRRRAEAMLRGR